MDVVGERPWTGLQRISRKSPWGYLNQDIPDSIEK
jgi:hypothetical protein